MSQNDVDKIVPNPRIAQLKADTTAPDGSEIRFLIDHTSGIQGASMVEVSLQRGQITKPVRHRSVEEIWYILEGKGQVWRCPPDRNPEEIHPCEVQKGEALSIPTLWTFQFRASENHPLRFLCITIPAWPGNEEIINSDFGGLGIPNI
jgi:mannose-6-phosphate isomerase-like protein (cupin superfamily)